MTLSRSPPLWSSTAQNPWMPLILVILLGQSAVMHLVLGKFTHVSPYLNAAHLLLIAIVQLFAQVQVTLEPDTLTVRYGYLGWPRQRIALERISAAQTFHLDPLQHGGWGYRGSLRFLGRAAVIVRAGPALRLEVDAGKHLSITVDDASTAARSINLLIARRGTRHGPGDDTDAPQTAASAKS